MISVRSPLSIDRGSFSFCPGRKRYVLFTFPRCNRTCKEKATKTAPCFLRGICLRGFLFHSFSFHGSMETAWGDGAPPDPINRTGITCREILSLKHVFMTRRFLLHFTQDTFVCQDGNRRFSAFSAFRRLPAGFWLSEAGAFQISFLFTLLCYDPRYLPHERYPQHSPQWKGYDMPQNTLPPAGSILPQKPAGNPVRCAP